MTPTLFSKEELNIILIGWHKATNSNLEFSRCFAEQKVSSNSVTIFFMETKKDRIAMAEFSYLKSMIYYAYALMFMEVKYARKYRRVWQMREEKGDVSLLLDHIEDGIKIKGEDTIEQDIVIFINNDGLYETYPELNNVTIDMNFWDGAECPNCRHVLQNNELICENCEADFDNYKAEDYYKIIFEKEKNHE